MSHKAWKKFGILLLVFHIGIVSVSSQTGRSGGRAATDGAVREKIIQYIRERFGVPASVKLTVGPFRSSFDPHLYAATVTIDDGKQKREQYVLVSRDGAYLIVGDVFNLRVDPRRANLGAISTQNQPTEGPANAPVTIVEYADLQCPMCARMHEFIRHEVLPKYGNKVRIIFKDFPLSSVHDWALTGAIASQCVYQMNPSAFLNFRSLVFQRQSSISAANARDALIQYGTQVGIDRLQLAACIDSKATLPRVEADIREGQKIPISSTPTFVINGRILVGGTAHEEFYKVVDEALAAAR